MKHTHAHFHSVTEENRGERRVTFFSSFADLFFITFIIQHARRLEEKKTHRREAESSEENESNITTMTMHRR